MSNILFNNKGVHPKGNKNTANMPTVRLTAFPKIRIPMSMHIGVPCQPLVQVGDDVMVGQMIGDAAAAMCVPIHASLSGKVTAVREMMMSTGSRTVDVEIESDGLYRIHSSVVPPVVTDRSSFLKAVRNSGLVGLGGASFPTHIKMNPPAGMESDVLVINAAECEPFITSDYRLILEHPIEVINGIIATLHWLNIPRAVIGIEDNKSDAAELLVFEAARMNACDKISIKILKTIYPQGAEKPLIFSTTGRKVPSGGLPYNVHVLVLNIATVKFIDKYLRTGMPLVDKRITLDGAALSSPCNAIVPIGSFITDIVSLIGGFKETPSKVIMGGPMMGVSLDSTDANIIKNNNAILFLNEEQAAQPSESACMRCSRCIDVCPMALMPTCIDAMSRLRDLEGLKKFHTMDCIECGCCSFICPAKRHLVQSIRSGKQIIRSKTVKK